MMKIRTKALDLVEVHKVNAEEGAHYFMMPQYLTKISTVENKDSGLSVKLDIECWAIYSYLSAYGYAHGYNSIYPNQDQIAIDLGMNVRTVQRKIGLLSEAGFVLVTRMKLSGKKDKNAYRLKVPRMLPRVRYLDIVGNILEGKLYKFDPSIFHKEKSTKGKDVTFEMIQALKGPETNSAASTIDELVQ